MGQQPSSHGNVKYIIDETVALDGDVRPYHVWDLEQDLSKDEHYIITAISRDGVPLRTYIIPDEELHHFTGGEEIWWEHRANPA